jgi:hypothetical protein
MTSGAMPLNLKNKKVSILALGSFIPILFDVLLYVLTLTIRKECENNGLLKEV